MQRAVAFARVRVALVTMLVAAGCAAGPTSPPPAVSTLTPSPTASPVPSDPESTDTAYPDFVPPQPLCPAPVDAVKPPVMTVAIKGGQPRLADMGSSSVVTCSTAGNEDRPVPDPTAPIPAKLGDVLVFTVLPGWRIFAWQASDHPRNQEGTNIIPSTATPGQPTSIEVPVSRSGDSIVAVDVWCLRSDGRAVASVSAFAWVRAGG
jgi:hypothetical protein